MPRMPSDRDDMLDCSSASVDPPGQHALALIVSRSPVNRVVLSRIAERSVMKAACVSPEDAAQSIARMEPAMIVLDGGADLHDCDSAIQSVMAARRLSSGNMPFVVMLTPNNDRPDGASFAWVDAYVSKPLTPERLQPLMERVRDSRR